MRFANMLLYDLKYILKNNAQVCIIFVLLSSLSISFALGTLSKFKDDIVYYKETDKYKTYYNIAVPADISTAQDMTPDEIMTAFEIKYNIDLPEITSAEITEKDEFVIFIDCIFKESLGDKQINALNDVTGIAPYWIYKDYEAQAESHRFIIIIISLIFVLVAFNLLNLYRYLICKNIYRFKIYRICGASKKSVFTVMIITPVMITAISYITAFALYRLIIFPIINRADPAMMLLTPGVLTAAFFSLEACAVIMLAPFILHSEAVK